VSYKYFLDFKDMSIDSKADTAVASIVEGHDVEFEISQEIFKNEPIMSSMRNLQHTIILRKKDSVWKIVDDDYNDYLWRLLKATGLSKDEMLNLLENSENGRVDGDRTQIATTSCNLPEDPSTYFYNRDGAIEYAHQWALERNPEYFDFSSQEYGGDCQNFVSQSIYEGGNALMYGSNTYGWYYISQYDYASAWTGVSYFFDFLTYPGYLSWPAGPEGCEVIRDLAYEGDLIQYDWEDDDIWDHSVVIVDTRPVDENHMYHWVAGHTPDVDNYPYRFFDYTYPLMVNRFLQIERLDGNRLYLALAFKEYYGMTSLTENPFLNPYPTP
jgi:hypothetical protein